MAEVDVSPNSLPSAAADRADAILERLFQYLPQPVDNGKLRIEVATIRVECPVLEALINVQVSNTEV